MAKTIIDNEKILEINTLYLQIKTYAGVARELNIAPSTVKKYIIPSFSPNTTTKKFNDLLIPEPRAALIEKRDSTICSLSEIEEKEIQELWKELVL